MTFLLVMVRYLIYYRKLQMWAFPSGINLEQLVILPGYTVLKNVVCSERCLCIAILITCVWTAQSYIHILCILWIE